MRGAPVTVEGDQTSIEHTDVDFTFVVRGAAIDDVAAGEVVVLAMDFRVVFPELLAGARVDRVGDAPRTRRIHHAVDHERRGLETAIGRRLELPGQAQFGDVGVVNLVERAEALLVVVAAVRQPVAAPRLRRRQGRIVHRTGGRLLRRSECDGCDGDEGKGGDKVTNHEVGF
jgi:hypothetical protein